MRCDGCANWTVARKTVYASGDEVETFRAPEGKGHCDQLGIDTPPDFGCTSYREGAQPVAVDRKDGAPWQHWTMIACPDCGGAGSSNDRPDDRCAGTGNVRRYDDGFIGDERTRLHPKEREAAPQPSCPGCGRPIDGGWAHCPACGHRLEVPAVTEVVTETSPTTTT